MGRAFHLGVALVALVVYLWAAFGQRHVSELASPLPALTYPARIQGLAAGSPAELRFLAQRFEPGTTVTIEGGAARRSLPVVPAFSFLHQAITLLTGLVFWAVCFFVFAPLGNRGA